MTVFMRNYSRFLNTFLSTIRKFCEEIVMQNRGATVISKQHLEMSLYQDSNDNGLRIEKFTYLCHRAESWWRSSLFLN